MTRLYERESGAMVKIHKPDGRKFEMCKGDILRYEGTEKCANHEEELPLTRPEGIYGDMNQMGVSARSSG